MEELLPKVHQKTTLKAGDGSETTLRHLSELCVSAVRLRETVQIAVPETRDTTAHLRTPSSTRHPRSWYQSVCTSEGSFS